MEGDGSRVDCWDARARSEDADQVEGSAAEIRTSSPIALRPARLPQVLDGFGEGELLAAEARHEAAAANRPARLHATQGVEKLSPRQRQTLARDDVPEDDAPTGQQLLRERFGQVLSLESVDVRQQRPAALGARPNPFRLAPSPPDTSPTRAGCRGRGSRSAPPRSHPR